VRAENKGRRISGRKSAKRGLPLASRIVVVGDGSRIHLGRAEVPLVLRLCTFHKRGEQSRWRKTIDTRLGFLANSRRFSQVDCAPRKVAYTLRNISKEGTLFARATSFHN